MMSRIPFDLDAITLSPPEARQLLGLAGSRFSEKIICLSFREFFIGAGGLNPFAHDFPWAPNIGSLPQAFIVRGMFSE
jgi:hypothetical protein